MAKQKKLPGKPKPPETTAQTESTSVTSARSLGRAIGLLQRELDDAIRRFNDYTARRRSALRNGNHRSRTERKRAARPKRRT